MNPMDVMRKKTLNRLLVLITLMSFCFGQVVMADTLYYVHTDHLGTPVVITDGAQATVWKGDKSPFGETTATVNQIEFNVRFPGQYYDAESGLHYNYFRDYDPATGRYVQSDPIGLAGGLNTYLYGVGNPLKYFDPFGLISTLDLCKNPKNAEACEAAGIVPKPKIPSSSSLKTINSNSELIAKGRDIRKVEELCEKFGGKAKDWKKKKGWDEKGQEWHWYENNGQKVGWKHAGESDPF